MPTFAAVGYDRGAGAAEQAEKLAAGHRAIYQPHLEASGNAARHVGAEREGSDLARSSPCISWNGSVWSVVDARLR